MCKYFYDFVVFTLLLCNNVRSSRYRIDVVKTYRFMSDSKDCLKMVVWSLNRKHEDLKWEGIVLFGCGDCISDYTLCTVYQTIHCISDCTLYIRLYTVYQTVHCISDCTLYIRLYTVYQTVHCISDYTLFTVIAQSCISDLLHDVLIGMQIIRYLSVPHNHSHSEADPCTVCPSCLPSAFCSSVV